MGAPLRPIPALGFHQAGGDRGIRANRPRGHRTASQRDPEPSPNRRHYNHENKIDPFTFSHEYIKNKFKITCELCEAVRRHFVSKRTATYSRRR